MVPPSLLVEVKDFEEFFLDDEAVLGLFDKVVPQTEVDDFVLLLSINHLSFTS